MEEGNLIRQLQVFQEKNEKLNMVAKDRVIIWVNQEN